MNGLQQSPAFSPVTPVRRMDYGIIQWNEWLTGNPRFIPLLTRMKRMDYTIYRGMNGLQNLPNNQIEMNGLQIAKKI
jgi:hypothetical protein